MKINEKRIFIITIIFTLVALAGMVAYNFISFYRNAREDMEIIGNSSLTAEINQLEAYLSQGSNTLTVASVDVDYMMLKGRTPGEIEQYLKFETLRLQEDIDENFSGVYGYVSGAYIDGSDWVPDADYVPTERDWYIEAAKADGETVIAPPYVDAKTKEVIISVCRLLNDKKSVLSLDIVLNRVQEITENINLNNMGYAFIVDDSGMVIAHNNSEEIGKNYYESDEMRELLEKAQDNDEYFNIKLNGEECYVFTGKAAMDSWRVIMIISRSKLLQSTQRILNRNLLVVILVYFVVIFFSAFSFLRLTASNEKLDKKQRQVEEVHSKLNYATYKSVLTGLKNRFSLEDDLNKRLKNRRLNIAYFDIDNFRKINEMYGYSAGDELLVNIADTLIEECGEQAEIYNVFGSEFFVLFADSVSNDKSVDLTNKMFEIMCGKYRVGNTDIKLSTSGTVLHYMPGQCESVDELLMILNKKVREIKANGGNNCKLLTITK